MIHYHGGPISGGASVAARVWAGRHAFVSYAHPEQLEVATEVCQSFAVDNGAFSNWRSDTATDWPGYYRWVESVRKSPSADFAVIPDDITGGEEANNRLIEEWPHGFFGAPVWHLDESLDRLAWLISEWPRVCLGSSGVWATPGTPGWWQRMHEAMSVACDSEGYPKARLHMLRGLDVSLFSLPLASADSTNVARNLGIDCRWSGPYEPPSKEWRGIVLAERVEAFQAAQRWVGRPIQKDLFGREVA